MHSAPRARSRPMLHSCPRSWSSERSPPLTCAACWRRWSTKASTASFATMPAPSRQRWRSAASPISCTRRAFSSPLATSTAGWRTCRRQSPTTSATARDSSRPRCAISAARWGHSARIRFNSRLTCGRRTSARPAQEPAIFCVDRLVALADVPFEGSPVENGDDPSAVADPSAPLQLLRRKNDSFPAYPEHVRDQLLRHPDLTAVDPIEAQQQPPAELLL